MIEWYVELQKVLRDIRIKAMDALALLRERGSKSSATSECIFED
jgi:hypothetical protein